MGTVRNLGKGPGVPRGGLGDSGDALPQLSAAAAAAADVDAGLVADAGDGVDARDVCGKSSHERYLTLN
jgi:hypothetical protein